MGRWAVHLITPVPNARLVMRILTAMCLINLVVHRDVLQPTLAANASHVKIIRTATSILSLVLTDAKHITLALNAPSASRRLVTPAPRTGVPYTPLAMATAALTEAFNPVIPNAAAPDAPILARV